MVIIGVCRILLRGPRLFFIIFAYIYIHWAAKAVIYLGGYGACSPGNIWRNGEIWCILKCISKIKISVFIATTTKKNCEFVRGRSTVVCSPRKLWKNGAIWCILKSILIKYQGKNSLKISVFKQQLRKSCEFVRSGGCWYGGMLPQKNLKKCCNLVHFKVYFNQILL